jgi:translation initiation factor 1
MRIGYCTIKTRKGGGFVSNANRKKKISSGNGFQIGGDSGMGVTLGALLGHEPEKPAQGGQSHDSSCKDTAQNTNTNVKNAKISRVSLQRQSAGRGGKTVTLVIVPRDCSADLEDLAKQMRKGLGCGSHVEEGRIVLQGDIIDRAEQWLTKYGVAKIVK